MATLKDMIDEIRSSLAGYTMRQDRITNLVNTNGISTTDTSIQIGSSSNLAKGLIEIDNELIWIDNFDKSTNTLNAIAGFGRGYGNTNPAPHNKNAQIVLSPTFPRVNIKQAINSTIQSVFPKLWSVNSTTFTFNPAVTTYALPDDAENILGISWQSVGPSKEWIPVKRWRPDKMANAGAFNSNVTVSIYDAITPGRTIQVWYTTPPNQLESDTEDFAEVTGLPQSSQDVIILGASHRLLSYLDAGRINLTSAESDSADTKLPSSAGTSVSKYMYGLFQQRLTEESNRLLIKYPTKVHYTR